MGGFHLGFSPPAKQPTKLISERTLPIVVDLGSWGPPSSYLRECLGEELDMTLTLGLQKGFLGTATSDLK